VHLSFSMAVLNVPPPANSANEAPPSPSTKMSHAMFLDELEQHNGDIGDIRQAMTNGGITPELTKKFFFVFHPS